MSVLKRCPSNKVSIKREFTVHVTSHSRALWPLNMLMDSLLYFHHSEYEHNVFSFTGVNAPNLNNLLLHLLLVTLVRTVFEKKKACLVNILIVFHDRRTQP